LFKVQQLSSVLHLLIFKSLDVKEVSMQQSIATLYKLIRSFNEMASSNLTHLFTWSKVLVMKCTVVTNLHLPSQTHKKVYI